MSIGFHYFETIKQSLSLQWLTREEAPQVLGRLLAIGSVTSLVAYGALWVSLEVFGLGFKTNFLLAGSACLLLAIFMWVAFPQFKSSMLKISISFFVSAIGCITS